MGSKLLCSLSLTLLFCHFSATAASTIGDISNNQQSTLMLQSALARAKLEKELNEMKDVKVSATELCTNKGIGLLSLKAVYGVGNRMYASFYYNSSSASEAKAGDTLLCGEKVKAIGLDRVEVLKDGITYILSGSSHAVAKK
jgi:type IV pilus biogenesis protein PilP